MTLLPSLRHKKRYIVFELEAEQGFSVPDIREEVEAALLLFLGQLGLSKASPQFLPEKCKNNRFIVKVNHDYVDECLSALMLIKKIKKKSVIIRSVAVSGILDKASSQLK